MDHPQPDLENNIHSSLPLYFNESMIIITQRRSCNLRVPWVQEFPDIQSAFFIPPSAPSVLDTVQSSCHLASNTFNSGVSLSRYNASYSLKCYLNVETIEPDFVTELLGTTISTAEHFQLLNSQGVALSPDCDSSFFELQPGQLDQRILTATTASELRRESAGDSCIIIASVQEDIIAPNSINETMCSRGGQSYRDTSIHNTESDSNADSSIVDITPSIWTITASILEVDNFLQHESYKLTPGVAKLVYSGIMEAADLHVDVPLYNFHMNCSYVKQAAISDIPHFQLGHIYGANDYKIFLLFPNLWSRDRKTNYLQDAELACFMDKIFLPAIHKRCPVAIVQYLPASFEMAKLCSLAAGVKPRSRQMNTSGHTEILLHFIPQPFLHEIWKTVIAKSHEPGLLNFSEPVILIDAKNLKLATMSSDIQSTVTSFLTHWNSQYDPEYWDKESVSLDLGSEEIHERGGFRRWCHPENTPDFHDYEPSGLEDEAFTLLWCKCCLGAYEYTFSSIFLHESCQFLYYEWALTREIANLNVIPGKQHRARAAGLVYSQFYTTTKEIFDAAKLYPFQNKALEGLTVDPKLNSTWQEIVGQTNDNPNCIKKAYLASKRRALASIDACSENSCGTQQEHDVNLNLLTAMSTQFEQLQNAAQRNTPTDQQVPLFNHPYMISLTNETVLFLLSNLNKLCFRFEYTRSLSTG
ncbi:hypothetical protein L873DRAFT_1848827 [Choiromyces venosus 120613-1]|uniref:Uncharacterized protein n=1 Tax=Choiromyces venosus 120613-1 TaxID=1336337 RepID=A0A3N4IZG4_9PEZI|nr:hypothetical protein L873DRAFT_1848827 [Choiromyces venosus 120613-1]